MHYARLNCFQFHPDKTWTLDEPRSTAEPTQPLSI